MQLNFRGKPFNIKSPIVGEIRKDSKNLDTNKNYILFAKDFSSINFNKKLFAAYIIRDSEGKINNKTKIAEPIVYDLPLLNHLEDGDIVVIHSDGVLNTLYKYNHVHNTFFVTDRCNSNCLMCSQPPKDRDDIAYLHNINMQMVKLLPESISEIGITGGEPTLLGEKLIELTSSIYKHLPKTRIHILTNGRSFAWKSFINKINNGKNENIIFAIPLYSDYYHQHDYIVQAKDAFYQTVLGIHNLARYGFRIEIRIVLHKQSIPRLFQLAKYIYKNMSFVEHVAFMGLEIVGYTPHNDKLLWIDPTEYSDVLSDSVLYLAQKNMDVSIYNTPLCLLPENLWKFARKSISDWKQTFLDECNKCSKIDDCGGVFETSKKYSKNIKAITFD